jgi:DNA-binding response OmpR family regulator
MVGGPAKTVLVVEDDPSLRMLCRVNLELEGYRVLEAATVAEARAALAGGEIELMLLDVHLGHEDSRPFLRELREQSRRPAVALFTGSARLDAEERALADSLLPKPFTLELLREVIGELAAQVDSSR